MNLFRECRQWLLPTAPAIRLYRVLCFFWHELHRWKFDILILTLTTPSAYTHLPVPNRISRTCSLNILCWRNYRQDMWKSVYNPRDLFFGFSGLLVCPGSCNNHTDLNYPPPHPHTHTHTRTPYPYPQPQPHHRMPIRARAHARHCLWACLCV